MRVISLVASAFAALSAVLLVDAALDSNAKMYGINYDRRQAPDWDPNQCKSKAQVDADMKAIAQIANSVRIYGLSDREACHTSHILDAAKREGLQVALGMWTGLTTDSFNAELARVEGLLKAGAIDSNIVGMHVGSEALLRKEYSATVAVSYLNQVRSLLKKYNSPLKLTITDVVDSYYKNPQLLQAVDYASINAFSFWEKADVKLGTAILLDRLRVLRTQAEALGKEVVISETGWASDGQDSRTGITSLENQRQFFQDFYHQAAAHAMPYYWFVAFESVWQNQLPANVSSPVEGYFGVLNTDRSLKSNFVNLNLKSKPVVTFRSKSERVLAEAVDPANVRTVTGIVLLQESAMATKLQKLQSKWFFDTVSGQVRSINSDRCLHAYDAVNGGKVDTTTCVVNEPKQKWSFDAKAKRLTHVTHKGFCLDYVPSSNFKLHLYKCSATSPNQDWDVVGLPTTPTTNSPTTNPPTDPWSAGTVRPPNLVPPSSEFQGGSAAVNLAVRFVTKQSVSKPFAQLVRVGEAVGLQFSPVKVDGSEWIYDEATKLVRSKDTNYCLDAYEPWDAGRVHVWACNPAERNQLWFYDAGTGQLKHVTHKGFCLDADQAANKNNGVVQLYWCHLNNNNQVWRKLSSAAIAVRLTNKDTSVMQLMDQDTLATKPLSALNDAQVWYWDSVKGTAISKWNGECLDAYEPVVNGRVHTWECIATEKNQLWKAEGGQLKHATHAGFCLGYSSATNKQLVLKKCVATDATQLFTLAPVKA